MANPAFESKDIEKLLTRRSKQTICNAFAVRLTLRCFKPAALSKSHGLLSLTA